MSALKYHYNIVPLWQLSAALHVRLCLSYECLPVLLCDCHVQQKVKVGKTVCDEASVVSWEVHSRDKVKLCCVDLDNWRAGLFWPYLGKFEDEGHTSKFTPVLHGMKFFFLLRIHVKRWIARGQHQTYAQFKTPKLLFVKFFGSSESDVFDMLDDGLAFTKATIYD